MQTSFRTSKQNLNSIVGNPFSTFCDDPKTASDQSDDSLNSDDDEDDDDEDGDSVTLNSSDEKFKFGDRYS